MTTVLAIDPGSRCGFALVQHGELVTSGTWKLHGDGDRNGTRFWRLFSRLGQFHHLDIDEVAYEGKAAGGKGAFNLKASYGYIGCIESWAVEHGFRTREVYPSALKKMATGNGRADKAEMIRAASARAGRPVKDDNEADAVCLAFAVYDELTRHTA